MLAAAVMGPRCERDISQVTGLTNDIVVHMNIGDRIWCPSYNIAHVSLIGDYRDKQRHYGARIKCMNGAGT